MPDGARGLRLAASFGRWSPGVPVVFVLWKQRLAGSAALPCQGRQSRAQVSLQGRGQRAAPEVRRKVRATCRAYAGGFREPERPDGLKAGVCA